MDSVTALCELVNILVENASYDCPASADKIAGLLTGGGDAPDAGAKERAESLLEKYLDKPLILGIALRKKDGGYYAELPFAETDIVMLRSMLLNMPYCERWQLSQIYGRLEEFLPSYMRDGDSLIHTSSEKYRGTFYDNISGIVKALYPADGVIRKLCFDYCEYGPSLELVPRISKKSGTSKRTVDPIKVVCANSFFYLVTFVAEEEKIQFINYRIDRMKNVECTDTPAELFEEHISEKRRYILDLKRSIEEGRRAAKRRGIIYSEPNYDISDLDDTRRIDGNGFNLSEYIFRSKIMYTDTMVDRVRVKLDRNSLGGVIDLFGFDIDVYPLDDKTVMVDIHNVTEMTVIKWALQFSEQVEIMEPAPLRSALAEKAAQLTEKYRQGDTDGE